MGVVEARRGTGIRMRRRKGLQARKEQRAAYLFLSPWLIGLIGFLMIPIVASRLLSFSEYDIITPRSGSASRTTGSSSTTGRSGSRSASR